MHPEHNDVEEAICYVELTPSKFGYDVADWHFKQPPASLLKAHLLRIVKGWGGETALHDYLTDNPIRSSLKPGVIFTPQSQYSVVVLNENARIVHSEALNQL